MNSFEISPALEADLPSIATVSLAAFKDSPNTMSYWIFPQDNHEAIYRWRLHGVIDRFHNDPTTYLYKCVDTATTRIVSFALWQKPHASTGNEEQDAQKSVKNGEETDIDALPEGTNVALKKDFDEATLQMRRKYVNMGKDYSEDLSFS
ncbi:hypothetical protein ACLMJK_008531 [Lecanora helva]